MSVEDEITLLRSALRTAVERLGLVERRLFEHDQQIANLEDGQAAHEAALRAFNAALAEIADVRRELCLLRGDVADATEP